MVHRRKQLLNSVANSRSPRMQDVKRTGDCSSIVSSDCPSPAANDSHLGPKVDHEGKSVGNRILPPLRASDSKSVILKSESFNECSVTDEAPKKGIERNLDVDSLNDRCSSSKSNSKVFSALVKVRVEESGECSSSNVTAMENEVDDLSGRDLCISILRSHGFLRRDFPSGSVSSVDDNSSSGGQRNCFRSCKTCSRRESALKMLICDHCEDAFHFPCCTPRMNKVPVEEWFCSSCMKNKHIILKEKASQRGKCSSSSFKRESNPIALMLKNTEPYTTGVRIGKNFQAEVSCWSGPMNNDADTAAEPIEIGPTKSNVHNIKKLPRHGSVGNWLQCQRVIDDMGEGYNGLVCGKWRRAPLFEVQTDDWECFSSVLWDPPHADCAVPQELDTNQVLKQLKYVEMLRSRLGAKRQKVEADQEQC